MDPYPIQSTIQLRWNNPQNNCQTLPKYKWIHILSNQQYNTADRNVLTKRYIRPLCIQSNTNSYLNLTQSKINSYLTSQINEWIHILSNPQYNLDETTHKITAKPYQSTNGSISYPINSTVDCNVVTKWCIRPAMHPKQHKFIPKFNPVKKINSYPTSQINEWIHILSNLQYNLDETTHKITAKLYQSTNGSISYPINSTVQLTVMWWLNDAYDWLCIQSNTNSYPNLTQSTKINNYLTSQINEWIHFQSTMQLK